MVVACGMDGLWQKKRGPGLNLLGKCGFELGTESHGRAQARWCVKIHPRYSPGA